jgi:hypothetical protein
MAMPNLRPHGGFTLMIGISPFASESERDEDGLDREHDVSEHGEDGALHLPKFHSEAEVRKHVECLKAELAYYEALLSGDEHRAASARKQLFAALGNGDDDE